MINSIKNKPMQFVVGVVAMGVLGAVASVTAANGVVVDEELSARADRFGIKIQVWTVNEESEMRSLLNAGVHGIMSDDPVTLQRVLDSRM